MPRGRTFEEVFTEAGYIPVWVERGRVFGNAEGQHQVLEWIKQGYTTEQLKAQLKKNL